MSQHTKTYSELSRLVTFEDRFEYLRLGGAVGRSTFGFDRYLNQQFYQSHAWKMARRHVIIRDNGCDLGVDGYDIHTEMLIHHLNPIVADDIIHGEDWITDPEFLITTTQTTHNAIHYGDQSLLASPARERQPGDTKLW
jgi:hypothetical protein